MSEFREERPTLADGVTHDPTPAFHKPAYRYIRAADLLPSTDAAYEAADPLIRVKLFDPIGSWTWYIGGYDPDRRLAYGAVDGFAFEVGDFSMSELTTRRVVVPSACRSNGISGSSRGSCRCCAGSHETSDDGKVQMTR